MEVNNLENINERNLEINLENGNLQKNFLETILGKAINTAIDMGMRAILPDFIENQIINIKDNLISYGLKDGIDKTIEDAIDIGKSVIGVVTGNFENVNQMQSAIKAGRVIDSISNLLDITVNKVSQAGLINNKIAKNIKDGKNIILNNIEKNIDDSLKKQSEGIEYVNKYINNWKKYFGNKDFKGMEKEYNKIEKQLNNIVPIEKIINEARTIEILHNLIKNNGKNFNLTEEQLELAEKLR